MERKSFERGTVVGGIVRIAISAVAVIVAVIVLKNTVETWDPEELGGKIFMCVIAGFMIIAAVAFVINGAKMIVDGSYGTQQRCGVAL